MNSVTLDIIIYSLWGAGALILIFLIYQLWVARKVSQVFKKIEDENDFEQLGYEFGVNAHKSNISEETQKWSSSADVPNKLKIASGDIKQVAIKASMTGSIKVSKCCGANFVYSHQTGNRCLKCNKFCKTISK